MFEMERINQNEMMALAFGLRERGIEFEIYSFFDGLQIRCDGEECDPIRTASAASSIFGRQ